MFNVRPWVFAAIASFTAAPSLTRAQGPDPTIPLDLWSEDFLRAGGSGLPLGWSFGPPAHVPFLESTRDHAVFGEAAPSIRVDLAPQTLNYRIASPYVPVPDLGAEYTLELSLKLDLPDSPFLVEVVAYDAGHQWIRGQRLQTLLGKQDDDFRRYRLSFRPFTQSQPGYLVLHLGLSYAKIFREGTVWIDDVALRAGKEVGTLEAYVTPTSVSPGEDVSLHVAASTREASVSIYRETATRERILGPLSLQNLTVPPTREEPWRNGAGWPSVFELTIPEDWPSGAYAMEVDDGDQITAASFAVHERDAKFPVLVILPNHTEQAYNEWGGRSFYSAISSADVSFERPLRVQIEYYAAPIHLLRWLSREGIPFAVANDDDLHDRPGLIAGYRTLIIAGHDEYWTRQMRRAVEHNLEQGGAVLALGGNLCWWQTRVETTDEIRRLVCYKYSPLEDPYQQIDPSLVTTHWDEPPLNEPANLFLGLSWREGGMVNWSPSSSCPCPYDWLLGYGGYTTANSEHWAFAGTSMIDGDSFGRDAAIVGYEVDGALLRWEGSRPFVTGEGGTPREFVVLGTSPCWNQYRADAAGVAVMGILERNGGFVFNAGTVGWSFGLAHEPEVQTMTRNLLQRALALGPPSEIRLDLSARPNPASDFVTIVGGSSGDFSQGGPPDVTCFDSAGRRVARLIAETVPGQGFKAHWNLGAGTEAGESAARGVAPGVYWIRAGRSSTRVVVVSRR